MTWRCESRALTGLTEQSKAGAEILQQLPAGTHLTPVGITRINQWNLGFQPCLGTWHEVCPTGHAGVWPKVGPDDLEAFSKPNDPVILWRPQEMILNQN